MTDIRALAERLRQIAESQRMDFDSPHVALTLDESAATIEAQEAKIAEALAAIESPAYYDAKPYKAERDLGYVRRILSADAPTEPVTGERLTNTKRHADAPTVPAPVLEREDDGPSGVAPAFACDCSCHTMPRVVWLARGGWTLCAPSCCSNTDAISPMTDRATPEVTDTLVDDVYALFVTAPGGMTGREAMRAALTAALGGTDESPRG